MSRYGLDDIRSIYCFWNIPLHLRLSSTGRHFLPAATRPFSLTTVRGLCLPPAPPLPPTTPHHHHHLCESDYFIYISSFTVLFHLNLLLTTFSEKLNRRKVTVVCLRYTCSCTCALAPRESEREEKVTLLVPHCKKLNAKKCPHVQA